MGTSWRRDAAASLAPTRPNRKAQMNNSATAVLNDVLLFISNLRRVAGIRFDKSPIVSVEQLIEFMHTRSAYVAQTSLYGYLKTRMGRDYVSIFKDERFSPSLNAAKWQVFAACLSDLCVYSIAQIAKDGGLSRDSSVELARYCHRTCVSATFVGEFAPQFVPGALEEFEARSDAVVWPNAAIGIAAFSCSPKALADSSPVSEEFKRLDRTIVENSVRFRWNDVRDQLRRRLDGTRIAANWERVPP